LVLKSWGVGPGDEVIVPSLTFIATVNVIHHVGATPVFADVDPRTFNLTPAEAVKRVTARTRAIIAVDQLGLPCDIAALSTLAAQYGLLLLDDAACAFGSRVGARPVGSFGDAAVFSLHARKVITTGEGGMIVTDDENFAQRLRQLRQQGMSLSDLARHGKCPTQIESYHEIGYNFRMTDIQAAIGLSQLERADAILARRKALAERYSDRLATSALVVPPFVPEGVTANWQSYQVTLRENAVLSRDALMEALFARGIHVRRGVMAAHLEPVYRSEGCSLPATEYLASHTLQLPLYPDLTDTQQDRVIAALEEIARG
jgi:perosamine synthetase